MRRLWIAGLAAVLFLWAGLAAVRAMPQEGRDKGIGPVKELKVGPMDAAMAQAGKKIFDTKCVVCHSLDDKKIGPPLRQAAVTRAPEWIMNMLLNVNEMLSKDPEAKKVRAQFPLPMTDQQLTQEQARQALEYLRQAAQEKKIK